MHLACLLLAVCVASACADGSTPATVQPRDITLRSHLDGPLDGDPTLRPGERIRLVPAPEERFDVRTPVLLTLPSSTPRQGEMQQYYLRGYAIGFASHLNDQFM